MQTSVSTQCKITGHFGIPFTARPMVDWGKMSGRSIMSIKAAVCAFYNIRMFDLVSERRTADLVRPRQIAMWLARKLTSASTVKIGRAFGGRDHSTVAHACMRVDELRMKYSKVAKDVADLTKIVEGRR